MVQRGNVAVKNVDKNVHAGHRMRMKENALSEGIDGLSPHNVLELLLFYVIPQIDTNEIAHELINVFGSLSEVLDAPYEELVKIKHITPHVASLIKLIPQFSRAYMLDKHSDVRVFDTAKKLGEYFIDKFIGETTEVVYLMLLDSSLQIINCKLLSKGSVTESNVSLRLIVDMVVRHNACAVAMAHNHPRGLALPSSDDLLVTSKAKAALKTLNIRFIDHIIVAQNEYVSIAEGYASLE